MNKRFILSVFTGLCLASAAQTALKPCGADELRISTLRMQPEVAKAVVRRDTELEKQTAAFTAQQAKNPSTTSYIIPVVFHVIHNYGTENISDAQLKDGIDIVNKTFNKTHPNTSSIIPAFQGIHANCDIEFRLATKDPNGNCHSGINRIASPLTNSGDHRVKSLIHWPPDKYLNVYVVANAAGLAGHAVWPADADTIPLWDGIVLSHNYVGTIGTSNLTQSVAFAHECGHYLNLHHIWGGNNVPNFYYYPCADPNKDCNIDDLVADTPPTIGWQSCNTTGASCGNAVDNVQNAMDYSYCNIMFTEGQKTRMHACLSSTVAARNNLWQTANLMATGVYTPAVLCEAAFSSDKKVVCAGSSIVYRNTSYHGTPVSYSWKFAGGTPATSSVASPTVTYATPGTYSVELTVSDGSNNYTVAKQHYVVVQAGTASQLYPFSEGFETLTDLNSGWLTNNLDSSNTWQLTALAASGGVKSVMINNFSSTLNAKNELYSMPLNLTGASTLNLSFRYAFARKDSSNKDQLQVFCSQSCGSTMVQRWSFSGAALETTSPKSTWFQPTAAEWKSANVLIPSFMFTTGFRLKFVFTGNGGNNIYLDDINLAVDAGVHDIAEDVQHIVLQPNPAHHSTAIAFTLTAPKTLGLRVTDILGKEVYWRPAEDLSAGPQQFEIPVHHLPGGVYMVSLSDGLRNISRRLIVSE